MNWRKRQIGRDDGDLIQFQFDQVLSRRGGHFSPPKSTRWSRNSEILQARYICRKHSSPKNTNIKKKFRGMKHIQYSYFNRLLTHYLIENKIEKFPFQRQTRGTLH